MEFKIAILDALADDFESIVQIQNYLLYLRQNISQQELANMINSMIDEGVIYINKEISDDDFIWYGMTAKGRDIWRKETDIADKSHEI